MNQLKIDITKVAITEAPKLSISKPGISQLINQSKKAFRTSKNSPSDTMVKGKVNSTKTGRTKLFTSPKITAIIKAIYKERT